MQWARGIDLASHLWHSSLQLGLKSITAPSNTHKIWPIKKISQIYYIVSIPYIVFPKTYIYYYMMILSMGVKYLVITLTFSSNALWCSKRDLRALRTSTSLETPAGDDACLLTTVILSERSWRDTRHSKCSSSNWKQITNKVKVGHKTMENSVEPEKVLPINICKNKIVEPWDMLALIFVFGNNVKLN